MKKMILLVTGIAVLAAGSYFGASLFAQGTGTTPAPAPAGTKVGVVNVGHVFNHWKKAQRFKVELEAAADPFNKRAKVMQEEMSKWDMEMRKQGVSKQQAEIFQDSITKNKRQLEDLAAEMRKLLGKKSEDNLVMLWKESNDCIKRVGEAYGFSIVMGYGDPLEPALMDLFPNVNRKMGAMDAGGAVPLYVHPSSDLSNAVTQTLNQWFDIRENELKKTSGTK